MADDFRDKTLLFVDDVDDIRDVTSLILRRYFKQIITAADGVEALEIFNTSRPDYIITDIEMPRMNGIELLKEIKKIDSQQPVIISTGFDDEAHRPGLADLILVKPVDKNKLLEAIRSLG